jgi:hypothetical protein
LQGVALKSCGGVALQYAVILIQHLQRQLAAAELTRLRFLPPPSTPAQAHDRDASAK